MSRIGEERDTNIFNTDLLNGNSVCVYVCVCAYECVFTYFLSFAQIEKKMNKQKTKTVTMVLLKPLFFTGLLLLALFLCRYRLFFPRFCSKRNFEHLREANVRKKGREEGMDFPALLISLREAKQVFLCLVEGLLLELLLPSVPRACVGNLRMERQDRVTQSHNPSGPARRNSSLWLFVYFPFLSFWFLVHV